MRASVSNSDDALWKPLGSLLVEKGLVTQEELDIALVEHERTGRRLGEVLVDLGVVSGSGVTKVLLEQLGVDLSQESGFGSGLRDQLDRRAAEAETRGNSDAPIIREVAVEEPERWSAESVAREQRRELELENSERRRIFGKRKPKQTAPLVEKKLSTVVADFERHSAALQRSLAEIRELLGELAPADSQTQRAAEL
jgi:hypothetical protein